MANKFNIVITATDKATAVVRKFKDQVSQITRPVRQTMASFKKFGKEVGLDKIAKGFMGVTKFAANAAKSVGGFALALAGIAVATSLAEIADLVKQWVFAGTKIQQTASVIGIGTTKLQALSGAARVFGLDAGAMEGALQNVGDTMEDALYGRNQDALMMMNRLSIKLHRTKDGAIDTAAALMDVAKAISGMHNAQAQALVARTFGMDGILPLLQKGPNGIAELERAVRATLSLMDPDALKRATEFQQKLSLLGLAVNGLGNSLANRLIPFLAPATSGLTTFIEKLSEAIDKHKTWDFLKDGAGIVLGSNTPPAKPGKPPSGPGGLFGRGGILGTGATIGGGKAYNPWDISKWYNWTDDPNPQVLIDNTKTHGERPAGLKVMAYNMDMPDAPPMIQSKPGNLDRLLKKWKGDIDDALIEESNGEGMVKRFLAAGRNPGVLPKLTQDFLKRAHADSQFMDLMRGGDGTSKGGAAAPGKPAEVHVQFSNTPPGTKVTAKPGGKVTTALRVDYALPDLATP